MRLRGSPKKEEDFLSMRSLNRDCNHILISLIGNAKSELFRALDICLRIGLVHVITCMTMALEEGFSAWQSTWMMDGELWIVINSTSPSPLDKSIIVWSSRLSFLCENPQKWCRHLWQVHSQSARWKQCWQHVSALSLGSFAFNVSRRQRPQTKPKGKKSPLRDTLMSLSISEYEPHQHGDMMQSGYLAILDHISIRSLEADARRRIFLEYFSPVHCLIFNWPSVNGFKFMMCMEECWKLVTRRRKHFPECDELCFFPMFSMIKMLYVMLTLFTDGQKRKKWIYLLAEACRHRR